MANFQPGEKFQLKQITCCFLNSVIFVIRTTAQKKKKKKQKQEVKALRRDFCCLNNVYRVVLLDKNERLGNPKL